MSTAWGWSSQGGLSPPKVTSPWVQGTARLMDAAGKENKASCSPPVLASRALLLALSLAPSLALFPCPIPGPVPGPVPSPVAHMCLAHT